MTQDERARLQDLADEHLADNRVVTILDNDEPMIRTPDYKAFSLAILRDSRDCLGHDIDGGFVQDEAVKHGLLVQFEAKEPCGEHCICADECGMWPVKCFRYSPDVVKSTAA